MEFNDIIPSIDIPSFEPVDTAPAPAVRLDRKRNDREARQRWDLYKRFADMSADIEYLTVEVSRLKKKFKGTFPDPEKRALEATYAHNVANLVSTHCRKVLQVVMAHKWALPFLKPVDVRMYKDYLDTVSEPMDFGTIMQRIQRGVYAHPDAFASDMTLVFENARSYNKPGSDVYVMAETLQEKFEDKYAQLVLPKLVTLEGAVHQGSLAGRTPPPPPPPPMKKKSSKQPVAAVPHESIVKATDAALKSTRDEQGNGKSATATVLINPVVLKDDGSTQRTTTTQAENPTPAPTALSSEEKAIALDNTSILVDTTKGEGTLASESDLDEAHREVLLKYMDQLAACLSDAKSAAAALCKPVTLDEKQWIINQLKTLPQEQFERAIAIVLRMHMGLLHAVNAPGGGLGRAVHGDPPPPYLPEVAFDIHMLDALTLRQLLSFVQTCVEHNNSTRAPLNTHPSFAHEDDSQKEGKKTPSWPGLPFGSGRKIKEKIKPVPKPVE